MVGHPATTSLSELRRELQTLRRENRILKARDQEFEERYQGPFDAEGVGGRPAVVILRDKNFAWVELLIDSLPSIPHWRPRSDPEGPELGFWYAVEFAQVQIGKAIDALWIAEPHHPLQVRDYHRAKGLLNEPFVYHLLRPDFVGFRRRLVLKRTIENLAFAPSARQVFSQSNETEVEPIQAERRGFQS